MISELYTDRKSVKYAITQYTKRGIYIYLKFNYSIFVIALFFVNHRLGGIDLWLYTRDNPVFEYSDIDSFRVFVCCQDAYGSSFSYLVLRLIEVKQETPYVPPGKAQLHVMKRVWFHFL